jgi:gamma-glutamyltranspeptidase/glutathione hydrolase
MHSHDLRVFDTMPGLFQTVDTFVNRIFILLVLLALPFSQAFAEYQRASQGMVSSRSDIASEAGAQILREGGNAIDAAVATGFALAVTYPSAGNLGGGGFMVLSLANGDVHTLDYREKAPLGASRDMFLDSRGEVDRDLALNSHQAAGVPGSVAGMLEALEKFGTMSPAQVLAPAIRLAEEGFILNEDLAGQFRGNFNSFRNYAASLASFSNNGTPYNPGDLWQQPDLAKTLKAIAEQGRDGFYKGHVADLIVDDMRENNGLITLQDLEDYSPVWRAPIHGTYRGYDIWSMPAPSSGGILLVQMLNMLESYDVGKSGWGNLDTIHLMIEAQRRAYADRAEFLGDPDYVDVPTRMLISKEYAHQRFADFDPQHATASALISAGAWPEESPQTTHYSVMDKSGNAVSITTTLNRSYGNKIVVPGAGFLLNNEMDDFSSKPDTPNSYGLIGRVANEIQPGKRMLSSMTPTIISKDGKTLLLTGSPGGSTIINTVLQVVMNIIDHGMSLQNAVASPRIHHQWMPDMVRYEIGAFSDDVARELEAMGHTGLNGSRFPIGDANSIYASEGFIDGVSDPRNVGGVAGY